MSDRFSLIKHLYGLLGALSLAFAGCAGPGAQYAGQHPELSAPQQEFLRTGKAPAGTALAGLTKEEIRLGMRRYPDSYDKVEEEEAWIYLQKKSVATTERDESATMGSNGKPEAFSESNNLGPGKTVLVKTTVFFQGGRATHVATAEEKP